VLPVDREREPDKFCVHTQHRQLKEALVSEWDNSIYLRPLRTVDWKRRIGDGDSKFAAGTSVFVQESETITWRIFWQLDDERRFALSQNAADGIVVDKLGGRRVREKMCGGDRRKLPVRRDVFDLRAFARWTFSVAAMIGRNKSDKGER